MLVLMYVLVSFSGRMTHVLISCCHWLGQDYETTHYLPWMVNSSFEFTHCEVPRTLARLCVEEGVGNFIHVSSLAADEHSLSRWARSKANGERAVRDEAPGATIVRPADMFGHEDRLLNLYVRLYQVRLPPRLSTSSCHVWAKILTGERISFCVSPNPPQMFPQLPLVDGGKARLQPLFVQDFARAVARLAMSEDPEEMLAQTYDLAGPEVYTQRELVEFVFEAIRAVRPHVANISPRIAGWIGKSFELLPEPIVSEDRMTRLQLDCVLDDVSRAKRLHDLGIEASSLEMPGYTWLHSFRTGSHFLDIKEAKQHSA